MRTTTNKMCELSHKEDLFKVSCLFIRFTQNKYLAVNKKYISCLRGVTVM